MNFIMAHIRVLLTIFEDLVSDSIYILFCPVHSCKISLRNDCDIFEKVAIEIVILVKY